MFIKELLIIASNLGIPSIDALRDMYIYIEREMTQFTNKP